MKFSRFLSQVLLSGAASLTLASCSSETPDNNFVGISPPVTDNVPQTSKLESVKNALMEGKIVSLNFNRCPFDDSSWEGANDPLGGIQCGNIYKISFNSATGEWTGVGFDEYRFATTGENITKTFTRVYPAPKQGAVLLWGGTYVLLEDGQFAMLRTSTYPQRVVGTYSF